LESTLVGREVSSSSLSKRSKIDDSRKVEVGDEERGPVDNDQRFANAFAGVEEEPESNPLRRGALMWSIVMFLFFLGRRI
jgi:hypothetical protein